MARPGAAWRGLARLGEAGHGEARRCAAWPGKVWQGVETTIVQARRPINAVVVGCGTARLGKARPGGAGQGKAGLGWAGQGKARQGQPPS